MKPVLVYEEASESIRQMPENYCIAYKKHGDCWTCDPDMAADKELATRVFLALFDFKAKWEASGLELLAMVTPNSDNILGIVG